MRGPGVPGDNLHLFATSNWMPYTWSINNVVMGENMHAALGFWQAGDPGEGFALFRSAFLASMFMGISPGNVGSMNYLDVYRRESQRDFADGAGVMSRALIEGLFGIRPDALGGIVNIEPGWPDRWNYAVLRAPQVKLNFHREEKLDRYVLELPGHGRSSAFKRARMRLRMQGDSALVSVNRKEVLSLISHDDQGRQWLAFSFPVRKRQEIYVEWVRMSPLAPTPAAEQFPVIETLLVRTDGSTAEPGARYAPVDLAPFFNDRVTEIFRPGKYLSPRSRFASLAMPSQGIGAWAGHVNATADIDDAGLRRAAAAGGGKITLPSGVPFMTPGSLMPPTSSSLHSGTTIRAACAFRWTVARGACTCSWPVQPITCKASSTTARSWWITRMGRGSVCPCTTRPTGGPSTRITSSTIFSFAGRHRFHRAWT